MEKQITDILELIKNGMKEIPEIGSKGWDMYVQSYKVDHLIQFIFSAVIVFLIIALLVTVLVLKSKRLFDVDDFTLGLWSFFGAIAVIILVFVMYFGIRGYLAPEYSIIRGFISFWNN